MPEARARSILVVDDREENRYVVVRMLRRAGYEVIEGSSGQQALELAARHPDLIILDVRLPDILGYEVCRRIKANHATANIPILHVSATFLTSESKVQALDSGADAYLTQPLEPPVLIATVGALLRLKDAEAISRLSARQWETTFDAMSEGIALLDAEGIVVRCNRAMLVFFRAQFGDVLGKDVHHLLRGSLGIDLAVVDTVQGRRLQEARSGNRWYSISADSIFGDQNEFKGHVLVVTDTTERKATEQALQFAEKLAATGRLANSIAHEINNPLEAVSNLLYLLKTSVPDPTAQCYIETATQELDRIGRITKQTLAFNRESKQETEVSIAEILDGLAILLAPQSAAKRVDIVKRYESKAPVFGFPGELRQVFANLLFNALEAVDQNGRIALHIRNARDWSDPDRSGIRVFIFDNGCGIPPQIKDHIFDAFFTTKQLKGSGLGLWLSLGIVTKHKGKMSVRSSTRPGKSWTCFSIFLPFRSGAPVLLYKKETGKTARPLDSEFDQQLAPARKG